MKSQALTLLASWVVAEPSLAVANKLHQQDLPNRILEDLVTRAHVYLPGPAAGATVQVLLHCPFALLLAAFCAACLPCRLMSRRQTAGTRLMAAAQLDCSTCCAWR